MRDLGPPAGLGGDDRVPAGHRRTVRASANPAVVPFERKSFVENVKRAAQKQQKEPERAPVSDARGEPRGYHRELLRSSREQTGERIRRAVLTWRPVNEAI